MWVAFCSGFFCPFTLLRGQFVPHKTIVRDLHFQSMHVRADVELGSFVNGHGIF